MEKKTTTAKKRKPHRSSFFSRVLFDHLSIGYVVIFLIIMSFVIYSNYGGITGLVTVGPLAIAGVPVGLVENDSWSNSLSGVSSAATALGDLDGDSDLDLIVFGSAGTAAKFAYTNNGSGFVANTSWSNGLTAIRRNGMAFGDVDNDGDLDLVAIGAGATNDAFVYLNSGSALTRSTAWDSNMTGLNLASLSVADLNGDGKLDVVAVGSSKSFVFINNGSGFEENATWQANLASVTSGVMGVADFDNDGEQDVLIIGDGPESAHNGSVFLNNGSGFAWDAAWATNITGIVDGSIAFGDVDNDRDIDLAMQGYTSAGKTITILYENNGSGLVDNQSWGGNLTNMYWGSMAFGDLDNDGRLDLFSTGINGLVTHGFVYLNNGTGLHVNLSWSANLTGMYDTPSAVLGDVDQDGALDLVLHGFGATRYAFVYISNTTIANTAPVAPAHSFNATYINNILNISWGNGTDAETTDNTSLYYNLRVGTTTGGNDIVSGVYGGTGHPTSGAFGNMMQRKNVTLTIADQRYFWSVQTIDAGLANSSWSAEQTYYGPPIVNGFQINASASDISTTSTAFNFTVNVTDDDLNISDVNITVYNVSNWAVSSEINSTCALLTGVVYECNYTSTLSLDGNYSFNVSAFDNASKSTNSTSGLSFFVDATNPTITGFQINVSSTNATRTSQSLNFTANVTDLFLNTSRVNMSIFNQVTGAFVQGVSAATCTVLSGSLYECNYTTSVSADGNYSFNVTAFDLIGNSLLSQADVQVNVDSTAPRASLDSPTNGSTTVSTSTAIRVNFSEKVDAATINSSSFVFEKRDGTAVSFTNVSADNTTWNFTATLSAGVAYQVRLMNEITDTSGNAMSPVNFTFTTSAASADSSSPTPPSSSGGGGSSADSAPVLDLGDADADNGNSGAIGEVSDKIGVSNEFIQNVNDIKLAKGQFVKVALKVPVVRTTTTRDTGGVQSTEIRRTGEFNNEEHTVYAISVSPTVIVLRITSTPQIVTITRAQPAFVDLNGDFVIDLRIDYIGYAPSAAELRFVSFKTGKPSEETQIVTGQISHILPNGVVVPKAQVAVSEAVSESDALPDVPEPVSLRALAAIVGLLLIGVGSYYVMFHSIVGRRSSKDKRKSFDT